MDESSMKERLAVLESEMRRTRNDVDRIFSLIREQIKNETSFQKKYLEKMSQLMGKINSLENKINNQRSFVGGIIFAVSGMWAIGAAIAAWLFSKG